MNPKLPIRQESSSARKLLAVLGELLTPESYADIAARIELAAEHAPDVLVSGDTVVTAMREKREGL